MVDFLVWQERWNTDIPDIDKLHIAMANQLNKIVEVLNQSAKGQEQAHELDSLLSDFYKLTREHFSSEESQMRQLRYPDYAAHHKEHRMLLAELAQLIREVKRGQSMLDIETLRALKQWFVVHLAGADKDYAKYYHTRK